MAALPRKLPGNPILKIVAAAVVVAVVTAAAVMTPAAIPE